MPNPVSRPSVSAELYDANYFLGSCGGIEFYNLYGPKVLKPCMAFAFKHSHVRPGMRVLDSGCGRGELLYHLCASGAETYGLDYSPDSIKIARSHAPRATLLKVDTKTLPFADNFFDRIFLLGVFEHLYPWELQDSFREFYRVLKPGGSILITTCTNHLYYKNWSYSLRRTLARGLRFLRLSFRDPIPPRSDEDASLHINEQSLFSIQSFFRDTDWEVRAEIMPNIKLLIDDLYGKPLPPGFPLQSIGGWRRAIYLGLCFRPPLSWFLGRWIFCQARKPQPR